jgi:hypothetical protein
MGKYFSEDEVHLFMKLWLEKYPDAIDRAHDVMRNPFRDNDEMNSRASREVIDIARELDFFKERAKTDESAAYHLMHDVWVKVADMLGPIGVNDIEE